MVISGDGEMLVKGVWGHTALSLVSHCQPWPLIGHSLPRWVWGQQLVNSGPGRALLYY